jgi:hypothetical protein
LPIANTFCPTRKSSLVPTATGTIAPPVGVILSTAMS